MILRTKRYLQPEFAKLLGDLIGAVPVEETDFVSLDRQIRELDVRFRRKSRLYLEDDPSGEGACLACGKKGTLGRCVDCGALLHYTCGWAQTPGAQQECPRCSAQKAIDQEKAKRDLQEGEDSDPAEFPADAWSWGNMGGSQKSVNRSLQRTVPKRVGGVMTSSPHRPKAALVGIERGIEERPPCPPGTYPTELEARKAGFESAAEWFTYSNSGALVDDRLALQNGVRAEDFASEDDIPADPSFVEQWMMQRGGVPPVYDDSGPLELEGHPLATYNFAEGKDVEVGVDPEERELCNLVRARAAAMRPHSSSRVRGGHDPFGNGHRLIGVSNISERGYVRGKGLGGGGVD